MKKVLCILLLSVLVVSILFGSTACSEKGIQTERPYYLYIYDSATERFVSTGTELTFGADFKTFDYLFSGGSFAINGSVEHTDAPDSYIISCNEEMVSVIRDRYKAKLQEAGGSEDAIEFYETASQFITPKEQLFVYGEYLFTGDSIELYHLPDADSASFDGYFHMEGSEDVVYLHGGNLYVQDEEGEYTERRGYYTIRGELLTLTSVDENGHDVYKDGLLYRKRYLMAKITLPTEGELLGTSFDEQLEDSDFASGINAEKSEYFGKTITVFSEQFFATDFE